MKVLPYSEKNIRELADKLQVLVEDVSTADLGFLTEQIFKRKVSLEIHLKELGDLLYHPYFRDARQYQSYQNVLSHNPQTFQDKVKVGYYRFHGDEFEKDLFAHFGVGDTSRTRRILAKAQDLSRSPDHELIVGEFKELIELVREDV